MTTSTPYNTQRKTLERDCVVAFVRGSGPGGQHRNKRYTGVRVHHRPSGLVQSATERRSQTRNLQLAYERLTHRLAVLNAVALRPERMAPPKPSKQAHQTRLQAKKRRGAVKASRAFRAEL